MNPEFLPPSVRELERGSEGTDFGRVSGINPLNFPSVGKSNAHQPLQGSVGHQQADSWVCCQLGAREHYAIPRALFGAGRLACMITDAWVRPHAARNVARPFPRGQLRRLSERFHPDLADATIHSFTCMSVASELWQWFRRADPWDFMLAKNALFQHRALRFLRSRQPALLHSARPILFCYSYAALELFKFAKYRGWRTVLGQIDPGWMEEMLVSRERLRHPELESPSRPIPAAYWENWHEECELADRIVVNSNWSADTLKDSGISEHKLRIIPLVFEAPADANHFRREYPQGFSGERRLRVLFLGQVVLRKGIAAMLEAVSLLRDEPIEFWIVGPQGAMQERLKALEVQSGSAKGEGLKVRCWGQVPRSETAGFYQRADVFLFPTLSDGFGLTQLEAQAWKLPIIASRSCGEVVKDGMNGLILQQVTGAAIADALWFCLRHPRQLEAFSYRSHVFEEFTLPRLQSSLLDLADSID